MSYVRIISLCAVLVISSFAMSANSTEVDMLHFDWHITLGELLTVVTLLGVGLKFHTSWVTICYKVEAMWKRYQWEIEKVSNGKA